MHALLAARCGGQLLLLRSSAFLSARSQLLASNIPRAWLCARFVLHHVHAATGASRPAEVARCK